MTFFAPMRETLGTVEDGAKATVAGVTAGAEATARAAVAGARKTARVTKECASAAATGVKRATVGAAKTVGLVARTSAVKLARALTKLTDAVVGGVTAGCDLGVGAVFSGLTRVATYSPRVESRLVSALKSTKRSPIDGAFLNEHCGPSLTLGPYLRGRRPTCGGYDGMPKVAYTNGIRNTDGEACESMKRIAEARCVEVVGIYNATDGFLSDIGECVEDINRTGATPAVRSQLIYLRQQLAVPGNAPVVLYAHSQGGLITQRALVRLKRQYVYQNRIDGMSMSQANAAAERSLGRVQVYSFGTAEQGWPVGPVVHRSTNEYDPVPKIIRAAQSNKPNTYPAAQDPAGALPVDSFKTPALNPHSMNDVYLPHMKAIDHSACRCTKYKGLA